MTTHMEHVIINLENENTNFLAHKLSTSLMAFVDLFHCVTLMWWQHMYHDFIEKGFKAMSDITLDAKGKEGTRLKHML